MSAHPTASTVSTLPGGALSVERMPGHWLLARLGKRVLRPGGLQATRWLMRHAAIGARDDVVELAPGMGVTARLVLRRGPRTYTAVERDAAAARIASDRLRGGSQARTSARVLHADATAVPLADESATVVLGEAMLSMQPEAAKDRIVAEAARVLVPGGRYALHELALTCDERGEDAAEVEREMSRTIHVGVRIHTLAGWTRLLEAHGFVVDDVLEGPMRLLEPGRLLRDEGVGGLLRFCSNALREPDALDRVRGMRAAFRRYAPLLAFVAIVAHRAPEWDVLDARLEERDGGPWVVGRCGNCDERVDVRVNGECERLHGTCSNGHRVRIARPAVLRG